MLIVNRVYWRKLKSISTNTCASTQRIRKRTRDRKEATRLRKRLKLQHSSRDGLTSWLKSKRMKMTWGQCSVLIPMIPLQSPTASSRAVKSQVQSTGISLVSTWCSIAKLAASDRTKIIWEDSCLTNRNGSPTWRRISIRINNLDHQHRTDSALTSTHVK